MASNLLERLRVPLVLAAVQTVFAGMVVLSRVALNNGVDVLIYNFYRSLIALVTIAPIAAIFERENRPPLNGRILCRIFVLAFLGLTASQSLFLVGISLTSASLGATLQNVVPVCTFVIALAMRVEVIDLKRRDGWAKIAGTVLCVGGAVTMSMYRGPVLLGMPGFLGAEFGFPDMQLTTDAGVFGTVMVYLRKTLGLSEWQVGTVMLLVGYSMWSLYLTLQVPVLKEFPAPLTITSITYLFATLQFLVVVSFVHGRSMSAWTLPWGLPIICVLYAGIMASSLAYTLQTWCIKGGGPLLAAAFMPLQCVVALVLAITFLNDKFFLGSCVGGLLIIAGLYLVVWGRAQTLRPIRVESDLEKALSRIHSFSSGLATPFLHNVDKVDKAPSTRTERDEMRDVTEN